ncbi:MAG: hypothetical protein H6608_07785 [Flavobacteriales bacterium]|nr:hypothetical protein [Flavobacteriales bacterium]
MKRWWLISIVWLLALPSCFRDDQKLAELPPFIQEIQTNRGKEGQLFYSLRDKEIKSSNGIYTWDLAFSCTPGDFTILVNSGKKMGVYNTQSKTIEAAFSPEYRSYVWTYDNPSSFQDGSAVGEWGDFNFEKPQSFGDVYILNRGFDRYNLPFQMKKFRVDGIRGNSYEISFGDVDDKQPRKLFIPRNDSFNFVYVSLDNDGQILELEPPKWDWDFQVTTFMDTSRYSNLYTRSDSVTPQYILFDGFLLNPYKRWASFDSTNSFSDLGFFDAEILEYSQSRNTIGNSWYDWNPDINQYQVSDHRTIVLRSEDLYFYLIEFRKFHKPHKEDAVIQFAIRNL